MQPTYGLEGEKVAETGIRGWKLGEIKKYAILCKFCSVKEKSSDNRHQSKESPSKEYGI